MSRKATTPKAPRKADLLRALQGFTDAVKTAGGIRVIESGRTGRRRPTLDNAYVHACKLLGEQPQQIVTEDAEDYDAQASYLVGKYWRLVELAENRGYSGRALAALVLAAVQADQIRAL